MEYYAGKKVEYYKNVRSEIFQLLPPHSEKLFEVGCGAGYTLSFLKESGRCSWVGGVELYSIAATEAKEKNIDLILEGSIDEIALPFEENSLDVILCLDVLEHLVDPWKVLKNLCRYLKHGGVLICSIPNVRHFRVVLPLLFKGEWKYSEEGILDKTHLRFFTKKTAVSLIEDSGCVVDELRTTGLAKWSRYAFMNLLTFGIFRPYFEYQYLIRGIKT